MPENLDEWIARKHPTKYVYGIESVTATIR